MHLFYLHIPYFSRWVGGGGLGYWINTNLTLLYTLIHAYTGREGSKSPDSVKSITGREILCKNVFFCYLFYVLNGVFGHV